MDKILDKLGIYDLFVNFITGMTILCTFCYLQTNLFKIAWLNIINVEEMGIWLLLLASYFIGIVFQEATNFIETVSYRLTINTKHQKLRCSVLLVIVPSIDRLLMTTAEIKQQKPLTRLILRKKLKRDLDDFEIRKLKEKVGQEVDSEATHYNEMLYNFCKGKINVEKDGRIANDQSHASMARSLSFYSFLIFAITLITIIYGIEESSKELAIIVLLMSMFCYLLFARRNKRFSEMRYVNVFRNFLYK